MKKTLFALAICILAGCTNKEKLAMEGAGNFLDAFLANDYNRAAECCTDGLKPEMIKAFEGFQQLDSNVRVLLVSECSQYKVEIGAVEKINDSDTFQVNYRIVKVEAEPQADDTFISSSLKVVDGKVFMLGE